MALTINEKRYQEIRASVKRKRLAAKIDEIIAEPNAMTFKSVDELLNHLDEQSAGRPARSSRKRP